MTNRLAGLVFALLIYALSAVWTVSNYGWTADAFLGAIGVMLVASVMLLLLLWLVIAPLAGAAAEFVGALGDFKARVSNRR